MGRRLNEDGCFQLSATTSSDPPLRNFCPRTFFHLSLDRRFREFIGFLATFLVPPPGITSRLWTQVSITIHEHLRDFHSIPMIPGVQQTTTSPTNPPKWISKPTARDFLLSLHSAASLFSFFLYPNPQCSIYSFSVNLRRDWVARLASPFDSVEAFFRYSAVIGHPWLRQVGHCVSIPSFGSGKAVCMEGRRYDVISPTTRAGREREIGVNHQEIPNINTPRMLRMKMFGSFRSITKLRFTCFGSRVPFGRMAMNVGPWLMVSIDILG